MPDVVALCAFLKQRCAAGRARVCLILGEVIWKDDLVDCTPGPEQEFPGPSPDRILTDWTEEPLVCLAILFCQPLRFREGDYPNEVDEELRDRDQQNQYQYVFEVSAREILVYHQRYLKKRRCPIKATSTSRVSSRRQSFLA